jgi:caffeoyl-CoA O-methyltransferase
MKILVEEALEEYAFQSTQQEPENLQKLVTQTYELMEFPQMITGRVEGRFLKLLVQLMQPKLIFEIGTFTGYSALSMAEGLTEGGKVITCEIDPKAQKVAEKAFDTSPFGHKIELRMGPAIETIRQLDQTIDLSFIDADKENYPLYYEEVLKRTRPGGVIIIDNALWSGQVLNPQDAASKAIAQLNEIISKDDRVESVMLTVRDGIQLVRKNL